MEKSETKKLLEILKTAYPKTYQNITEEQARNMLSLYFDMFKEYETEIVVVALKNYIKANEFPPTIAGLQKQIDLIISDEDTDIELWNEFEKACRKGSRITQEEFESLSGPIKKWCKDVSQIRELSKLDTGTFNTVIKGQFLKTITKIKEREKALKEIPYEVRQKLSELKMLE